MYRIVVQNHVIINSFYVSDIIRHNIIVAFFKMPSKLKTRYSSSHISSASVLNKDLVFGPFFFFLFKLFHLFSIASLHMHVEKQQNRT